MAARVIHYGWDDCYRVHVLRFAGYEVREAHSLEALARDLEREDQVDAIVLSEDDGHTLPEAVAIVRRSSAAPLILFRRTQYAIEESGFDRIYTCLVPPNVWLSQVAGLIATSRGLHERSNWSSVQTRAARSEERAASFPAVFDRVRVRGTDGIYLAFRINRDGENADLVQLIGKHRVERGISFGMLERVPEEWRAA